MKTRVIVLALVCMTIFSVTCDQQVIEQSMESTRVPTYSDYNEIAFEMMPADRPPEFMLDFKSILVVCVGAERSISSANELQGILRARGLSQRKHGEGYALFFNTQYQGQSATVTISLINPNEDPIYMHTASIAAGDLGKVGHNLRSTLAWKFATKWAIANHMPPKLVDLKSFLSF